MRKAFSLFALLALMACAKSTVPSAPIEGSIEVNPQLTAGEKNLPGMEGLSWRTTEDDVHAQQDGMLPRVTIEGCVFSRQARIQNWPVTGPKLRSILLLYVGPNTDFLDCVKKVSIYFTNRLGSHPMLWDHDRTRYWFGLESEIALGTYVESKERFFVSYALIGTMDEIMRVEE